MYWVSIKQQAYKFLQVLINLCSGCFLFVWQLNCSMQILNCSGNTLLGDNNHAMLHFQHHPPQFLTNIGKPLPPWFPYYRMYCSRIYHLFFFSFLVDLQCCVNFCCTAKWFSYTYMNILFSYSFQLWFIIGYWIEFPLCMVGPFCLFILYTQSFASANLKLLIHPSPTCLSPLATTSRFSTSESVSGLYIVYLSLMKAVRLERQYFWSITWVLLDVLSLRGLGFTVLKVESEPVPVSSNTPAIK